jgi:Fur family ferric uptake transcriptional regulator
MVLVSTQLTEDLEEINEGELEKAKYFQQHQEHLSPKVRRLLAALKARNFKVTEPRLLILEAIGNFEGEFTLTQLIDQMGAEPHHKVGVASIFRTVKLLAELDLLQRLHSADGCHRYTLEADHHHQVVCRTCGQQIEFGGCDLEDIAKKIEAVTGYQLDGHWLEFFGYCATCKDKIETNPARSANTAPLRLSPERFWVASNLTTTISS